MHILTVSLLFLAQTDKVSPTDIWPQWRGPTGDSIAPGGSLPTRWSQTENIVWKTPLPGWGNSTPAIWKNDIFGYCHIWNNLVKGFFDVIIGEKHITSFFV